jgi:Caudovirus prohead serine protease
MTSIVGPKGWRQDQILHRLDSGSTLTPLSYNAKARTVDAILSVGAPVARIYGTEILRIDPASVDLGRVRAGLAPVLDSHQGSSITQVLGRIGKTWFDGPALWGRLIFADTAQAREAEKMVASGMITGTSLGYRVSRWEITDADNNIFDPDKSHISWDDDLTYTATRFEILESSLVAIPADAAALIRKLGNGFDHVEAARERMAARSRMHAAAAESDSSDYDVAEIIERVILRHAEMEESSALLDAELEIADQALN